MREMALRRIKPLEVESHATSKMSTVVRDVHDPDKSCGIHTLTQGSCKQSCKCTYLKVAYGTCASRFSTGGQALAISGHDRKHTMNVIDFLLTADAKSHSSRSFCSPHTAL